MLDLDGSHLGIMCCRSSRPVLMLFGLISTMFK